MAALVEEANNPQDIDRHIEVLRLLADSDNPQAFAPLFKSLLYATDMERKFPRPSDPWAWHHDGPNFAGRIRETAWDALVGHGNEKMALFALKQVSRLPNDADREEAFKLACAIGGREVFEELIAALRAREFEEWLLSVIMENLVYYVKHPPSRKSRTGWTRDDREWLRLQLENLVLRDRDRAIRTAAVFGLQYLRDPASVPTFLKATKDSQPMVRTTALEALAKLPDVVVRGAQLSDT